MKHKFHFVLNSKLKKNIISISNKIELNISSTVVYIINLIYPLLEKYYYFIEEDNRGCYKYINADSNIYVFIDNNDYRKIRKIYNDMFVFSMAILIRWMIEKFLDGINKYGFERFIKILQRYGSIHNIKIHRIKCWKKYKNDKHMLHKSIFCEKYRMTFGTNYTLLGIELLI